MGGILASVIPGGHGFGGRRLPTALVAPPAMQICTSEIAAGNPPIGGFVVMVSSGQSPIRKGANLRNYSARGLTRTSAGAEVRGLCLWV